VPKDSELLCCRFDHEYEVYLPLHTSACCWFITLKPPMAGNQMRVNFTLIGEGYRSRMGLAGWYWKALPYSQSRGDAGLS